MTGTHVLEASDRAVFNLLYQYAHDSGRLLEPSAEWEMPLNPLRSALSRHDNNTRLRETLVRLKGVTVTVSYIDEHGEPRVVITGLFDSGLGPRCAEADRYPTGPSGSRRRGEPV